jgi:hypothetical protein
MGPIRLSAILLWILLLACRAARADDAGTFNPADYTAPVCPSHYGAPTNDTCPAKDTEIAGLPKDDCKGTGLLLNATTGKCEAAKPAPTPQCKPFQDFKATLTKGVCTYAKMTATSATGDYVGDCFKITTRIAGTDLASKDWYQVQAQKNLDSGDRMLSIADAHKTDLWPFVCMPTRDGSSRDIAASKLIESGAIRTGYTWGALTMPYKYYPRLKKFEVNAPVGGYFGYRTGQAGSGYTFAAALTLSSVKADSVDPNSLDNGRPKITGSTNVAALSGALGVMFDMAKSPQGKPFKAGFFLGVDFVNQSSTISYPANHKLWMALQLGYDFTDN